MNESSKQPRAGRGLRIALVASLAVNLLVVGLVLGVAANRNDPRQAGRVPPELLNYGPLMKVLDEDNRTKLQQSLHGQRDEIRQARREVRKGFHDLVSALRAEPFDPKAVERIMTAQEARVNGQVTKVRAQLLLQLTEMTAEDRAALADRMQQALKRGPDRKRPAIQQD
ncbi:periplasmic heavy metal sensor [Actibacterium mucosum]|uniref:periplasmic heavy metal sensor n=1 Tax=Actibacterium mucosum TaxID=1087332 RepID=UPI0006923CDD|nr:periplasmic heavy metal sensor [Actibacterium mucosum]